MRKLTTILAHAVLIAALTLFMANCGDSGGDTSNNDGGGTSGDGGGADGGTGGTGGTDGTDGSTDGATDDGTGGTGGTGGTDATGDEPADASTGTGAQDTTGGGGGGGNDAGPPAPECGDGTCNGTETCLTCVADCGECPGSSSLYCFEMNGCIFSECDSSLPEAQFQQCVQAAVQTCMGQAATPVESNNWITWQQCLGGCPTTPQDAADDCFNYSCSNEFADCFTGGEYGTGQCADIAPCIQACDPTGQDADCMRQCYSMAGKEEVKKDLEILLCASIACGQAADFNTCANGALGPGGACEGNFLLCQGEDTPPPADEDPVVAEEEPDAGSTDPGDATVVEEVLEDAGPVDDDATTTMPSDDATTMMPSEDAMDDASSMSSSGGSGSNMMPMDYFMFMQQRIFIMKDMLQE